MKIFKLWKKKNFLHKSLKSRLDWLGVLKYKNKKHRVDRYSCHPLKKESPRHWGNSWTLFFFFTPYLGVCFLGGGKNRGPPCI